MIKFKALLIASVLTLSAVTFVAVNGVGFTTANAGDTKQAKTMTDTKDKNKDKKKSSDGYKY